MKYTLAALTLALGITLTPVASKAFNLSSLTPTLTYPDPAPAPVSKDATDISK